jgi:hypothetical protein
MWRRRREQNCGNAEDAPQPAGVEQHGHGDKQNTARSRPPRRGADVIQGGAQRGKVELAPPLPLATMPAINGTGPSSLMPCDFGAFGTRPTPAKIAEFCLIAHRRTAFVLRMNRNNSSPKEQPKTQQPHNTPSQKNGSPIIAVAWRRWLCRCR